MTEPQSREFEPCLTSWFITTQWARQTLFITGSAPPPVFSLIEGDQTSAQVESEQSYAENDKKTIDLVIVGALTGPTELGGEATSLLTPVCV